MGDVDVSQYSALFYAFHLDMGDLVVEILTSV